MERIERELCQIPPEDDETRITLTDLVIRTKDRRLATFVPNAVQIKYLDELLPRWREGHYDMKGLRELILKARQFGFSTLIEALFFCDTVNTPNTTTVVVAHDAETTEKLFRMVKLFYEHLPPHKRPRAKYSSKREFYWPDINCSFYVGTAGAKDFGRSSTINNLHCSEVSFYPDAKELMTGLLNAVPDDGNVFQETTANGLGDFFHDEFLRAEAGDSTFTARFYGWYEHPEYTLDPRLAPPAKPGELEREAQLKRAYRLTDGQIAWRRRKLRQPGMQDKFVQEYPANPREAFVASGNPYFDRGALDEALESARKPLDAPQIPAKYVRLRGLPGSLEVFEAPIKGRRYTIGADPSEGLSGSGDHDYCSADVIDSETEEQVAHLHGRWEPHEFGLILAELGAWYETALLAVERNNHGHATLAAILHTAGYPTANKNTKGVYCHADFDQQDKDADTRRPGWPTTAKTKAFALDTLAAALLDGDVLIHSRGTIGEMMTFVKQPGGKAGGENGCHDDQAMSMAICIAANRLRPRTKRFDVY